MKFVLASANPHKVSEIRKILGDSSELLTPNDLGETREIPEDGSTLTENALQKAHFMYEAYGHPSIADDSGLEVEALNNEPGVYSARYAGEQKNSDDNIDLLLKNLAGHTNRKARFRTVIAYVGPKGEYTFEGTVEGTILTERHGTGGFGYDPVFLPDGYDKTFAEMTAAEKNAISHRARALEKFAAFLKER